LKDVTICSVDSVHPDLAARALRISCSQCDFGDAILVSHQPVRGPFRNAKVDQVNSTVEYARIVYKRLPEWIDTPFVLMVQWDGYVIDAAAWRDEFRQYDYIGARWSWLNDGMTVGNGGFSLRSRKFMSAMMSDRFPITQVGADWLICRTYRPALEIDYGVRFAPEAIADLFSYETIPFSELGAPWIKTFGFHGLGNAWRFTSDNDIIAIIDRCAPYVFQSRHFVRLVFSYFMSGQFEMCARLYSKLQHQVGAKAASQLIYNLVHENSRGVDIADRCIQISERIGSKSGTTRRAAVKLSQFQQCCSLAMARASGRPSSFK
jgi:hypothetical protein